MKIIDVHMHYYNVEGFYETAKQAGHENTSACWQQICEENNIVFAVAMGNTMDASVRYGGVPPRLINLAAPFNEEQYNQLGNIGYCLGVQSDLITEANAERTAQEFEFYLQQPHCLGLKFYPGYNASYVNEKKHWPLIELARKYSVPVVIHTGDTARPTGLLKYSHPLTVDEAAVNFPDVTFVIAHCGNPWIVDAVEVAAKNDNVCLDLSGLLAGQPKPMFLYEKNAAYFAYLRMWLNYLGRYDKVMYGSDWPLVNIPTYISLMKRIIPETAHEQVFYFNALRVFRKIGNLINR